MLAAFVRFFQPKERLVCIAQFRINDRYQSQSVWAGHPVSVDPSTLIPPSPPEFNPVCEKSGFGTLCTVNFSDPPFAGDSGLACGSGANTFEVFQFSTRSVQGRRYYDQNRNLLKRHFRQYLAGTFSNPLNHKAVAFSGSITHVHDLTIPGDNTSGTERLSGGTRIYLQNGGDRVDRCRPSDHNRGWNDSKRGGTTPVRRILRFRGYNGAAASV